MVRATLLSFLPKAMCGSSASMGIIEALWVGGWMMRWVGGWVGGWSVYLLPEAMRGSSASMGMIEALYE